MRVLHLTRDYPPFAAGGISTAVAGMVGALGARGVESTVLSFDGYRPVAETKPRPVEWSGDAALRIARIKTGADPFNEAGTTEILAKAGKVDVVHVHDPLLWEFGAALARGCANAPALATAHVLHRYTSRLRAATRTTLSEAAEAKVMSEATLVLAPSDAARDRLLEDYPAARARISVVPHGIDAENSGEGNTACGNTTSGDTAPQEIPTRAARNDSVTLLHLGRFGDVKGTAELLAALPAVLDRHPELQVIIAGGLPHSGQSTRRWQRRFEALGDRVRAPGWLDEDTKWRALQNADLFVAPSWTETFGLSVMEAGLFALPVVATRSGGVEMFLRDDDNAFLCPPRDSDALARRIGDALANRDQARTTGEQLRRDIRDHWLWDSRIEALIETYKGVAPSA